MRPSTLLARNFLYYWRTNLAVVLGVAIAVAVLTGALLVGDSVRASLRDLVLERLGNADYVVSAASFFRDHLAQDLASRPDFARGFGGACPLIALEGMVAHEPSKRRATGVQVYGVDNRFWDFHGRNGVKPAPDDREILLSPGLAEELGAKPGDSLLLTVEKPSAIPLESLHGRKDDLGRTIRFSTRQTLSADSLGEFSLRPQQGAVRAVFVPLRRMQRELKQDGRVNAILISEQRPASGGHQADLAKLVKVSLSLEDLGIKLRALERQRCISLESQSGLIGDALAEKARATTLAQGMRTSSTFTYLANTIRAGQREIPYSLVAAVDAETFQTLAEGQASSSAPAPMVLNDWAARELSVRPGDSVTLEYYVWKEEGRLLTESAQFQLKTIVPLKGTAADPDLAPEYPGITESKHLQDWDPPFPIDLSRIRPRDEQYWDRYRTTPKAFIQLEEGQKLWRSRFGRLTSLRIYPANGKGRPGVSADSRELLAALETYRNSLRAALDPAAMGFSIQPVRAQSLEASQGATDFGEYFVYFSFFLMVSALLLVGLFFRLGVEQRLREIGLLRAVGFPIARIRTLFVIEGVVLAVLGSLLGLAGALGYGALVLLGLRTWWVDAVGTRLLSLHVSAGSLLLGGAGAIAAALLFIFWSLRNLQPVTPRSLLAGATFSLRAQPVRRRNFLAVSAGLGFAGLALLLGAFLNRVGQVPGFFGAGILLLAAFLLFLWVRLSERPRKVLDGVGVPAFSRLGFRNAAYRPGRSVLCITLIAAATFVIVAVDAFRRQPREDTEKQSGSGGFPLLAESLLPLPYDLNAESGKEGLRLSEKEIAALKGISLVSFRLRPGDDASCLNLYRPQNPRVLAVPASFIRSGRFSFQASLAGTAEEKKNPWLLLETAPSGGAIPAIADANTMTYVLHLKLGDEFVLNQGSEQPVRLRLVAALSDSIFQRELLIGEKNFLRAFPHEQGYRFFLLDVAPEKASEVTGLLEQALSDYGFDIAGTAERLAAFHRVENTYLSTFQSLGGLGLLMGTLGLAAVLLRNVLERRRELALLRAVGFRPADLAVLVIAENVFLLACGLVAGTVSALLAVAPAFFARSGQLSVASLGLLLLAVLAAGLTASVLATVSVLRSPLLAALRAE